MPAIAPSTRNAPAAAASQKPALNPAKMPMPPSSGVGVSCQRSAEGTATRRRASGVRRRSQIAPPDAARATTARDVLTVLAPAAPVRAPPGRGSEGSRRAGRGACSQELRVTDGCEVLVSHASPVPAPRRPRLGPDGGLRRPRALPRALREPLPAQLPGQVPRLRARDRLVARQPARADGRLPARLRRPPPADRDPALPALPARRARLLDLLRDLAAGGLPLARRRGGARPQGALPAAARPVRGRGDAARHVRAHARDPGRALARLRPVGPLDGVARDPARGALRRARLRRRAR